MGVLTCPVPVGEQRQGCSAMRMWRSACHAIVVPDADGAWQQIVDSSPPDSLWHSLRNCVAYQAGVWQNLLNKGIEDVMQPAAFKIALVLRHTPSKTAVKILYDLLHTHPYAHEVTSYILALLTDDEAKTCGGCSSNGSSSPASLASDDNPDDGADDEESEPTIESDNEAEAVPIPDDPTEKPPTAPRPDSPDNSGQPDSATADNGEESPPKPDSATGDGEADGNVEPDSAEPDPEGAVGGDLGPAPSPPPGRASLRDLKLFGDCELAVLAASREEYDAHAKLVRAEYSKLTQDHYVELRIKVLNQFNQIPRLYHSAEFERFESAARENIEREICTLREHLLTGRRD